MGIIETHAHIYDEKFADDREDMLERAREAGVEQIVMPNVDHESIEGMMELEDKHPDFCKATMGLHPCSVDKHFEKALYEVEEWLGKRPFQAVGEIGLDFYWDKTFIEQQKEALRIQIGWAKQYAIPIILHCRDSFVETYEIVAELADEKLSGVFHCFTGSVEYAEKIAQLPNFYMGIGGVSTFKNGGMDKVLPDVALERMVLETDSPYLAPAPHRGKRNEPAFLPKIVEKLAAFQGKGYKEIIEQTSQNARQLFKL